MPLSYALARSPRLPTVGGGPGHVTDRVTRLNPESPKELRLLGGFFLVVAR